MCGRLPRLKKVNLSVGNLRKTPAGGAGTKGKPPIICICNRLEATEAVWVVCHYSQSTSSGTRDRVRSPLPAVGALSLKRLIGLKRRGMIFNHESKRRLTRSGDRDHAAMLNTHLTSEASWSTTVEPVGCWGGGAAAIGRARFPTSGGTQRFPRRGRITFLRAGAAARSARFDLAQNSVGLD